MRGDMICRNCGRPAVLEVGRPGQIIPVCLDCNLKLQQASAIRHNMLADAQEKVWAEAAAITGLPNPRPPRPRAPVLQLGDVSLNNITLHGSTVGLLNTGYLGTIDGAITVLGQSEGAAAQALRQLTEAVANSGQVEVELKNELLELLSLVASESAAPQETRRSKAILAVLERLSNLLQGTAALSDLAAKYMPSIVGLFQ